MWPFRVLGELYNKQVIGPIPSGPPIQRQGWWGGRRREKKQGEGVEEKEKGRGRGTTKMLPADMIYREMVRLNCMNIMCLASGHVTHTVSSSPLTTRPSGQGPACLHSSTLSCYLPPLLKQSVEQLQQSSQHP